MVLLMTRPATDAQAAFEQHVLPELEILYRTARSLTRSSSDAEDLVQETLLRAFRAIERFDGRYPRARLMLAFRMIVKSHARAYRPSNRSIAR